MIEVRCSAEFGKWLNGLRDANAYARIVQRIRRLERGNPGGVKSVGGGLHKLRVDYGPGYRDYFVYEGSAVVILLCGVDKGMQSRDIKRARDLAGRLGVHAMETTRFDASELLDTPVRRAAYLSAAFETGDPEEIRDALGIVVRARGLAEVAREANISRTSLYKTLGGSGNPEFGTVVRLLASLGIRLTATPVVQPRKSAHRTAATKRRTARKLRSLK